MTIEEASTSLSESLRTKYGDGSCMVAIADDHLIVYTVKKPTKTQNLMVTCGGYSIVWKHSGQMRPLKG